MLVTPPYWHLKILLVARLSTGRLRPVYFSGEFPIGLEWPGGSAQGGSTFLRASGHTGAWVKEGVCSKRGLVVPGLISRRCRTTLRLEGSRCITGAEPLFSWMLVFPFLLDQDPNGKQVERKCNIGWGVKKTIQELVLRQAIAETVHRIIMDLDSQDGKEIRKRASKLQWAFVRVVLIGGSCYSDVSRKIAC